MARASRPTGRLGQLRRAAGRCCVGLGPRLTRGTDRGEEGGHDEGLTLRGEGRETTGNEEMAVLTELGGAGSGSKRL
jgi:hypothetical protein